MSYRYYKLDQSIGSEYYAPLGKDRQPYSGIYSHADGEQCAYSWSGDGNNWVAYPDGINSDGRGLDGTAPYLGTDGEWHVTYYGDADPIKAKRHAEHYRWQWDDQLKYCPLPEPAPQKDRNYQHQPILPALKEQYATWGNPEAARIGKVRSCDVGLPTKQRGKWEYKEAAWEEAILVTRNRRPSEPLSMDREDGDGDSWEPTSGDPMDALIEAEENEMREESRQYLLGLVLRSLTKRQRKCLELQALGLTETAIAKKMRISQPTVSRELSKIAITAAALGEI